MRLLDLDDDTDRRTFLAALAGLGAGIAVGDSLDDNAQAFVGGMTSDDEADPLSVSAGFAEIVVADTLAELDDPDNYPAVAITADAGLLIFDET